MTLMLTGLVIFFGIHVLPWLPALRERLVARFGAGPYRGLFSVVAGIGLVLLVVGYGAAPKAPVLWTSPAWGPTAALVAVPAALILIASAYLGTHLKRLLKHPFNIGIALWAGVHLLNNGDLPSLLLFGGFGVYALADIVAASRRGRETSPARPAQRRDLVAILAGLILAGVVAHFHATLFGVPIPL
jgi:uncharacterized membrane protein